jgi:hypothetical protein
VAAKPVDSDHLSIVRLANHASKLARQFIELESIDRYRMVELLAELEHVIAEFRRLRPPPTFRREPAPSLRVVRVCTICELEIREHHESFETPGAAYHAECYERVTGIPRRK